MISLSILDFEQDFYDDCTEILKGITFCLLVFDINNRESFENL